MFITEWHSMLNAMREEVDVLQRWNSEQISRTVPWKPALRFPAAKLTARSSTICVEIVIEHVTCFKQL